MPLKRKRVYWVVCVGCPVEPIASFHDATVAKLCAASHLRWTRHLTWTVPVPNVPGVNYVLCACNRAALPDGKDLVVRGVTHVFDGICE